MGCLAGAWVLKTLKPTLSKHSLAEYLEREWFPRLRTSKQSTTYPAQMALRKWVIAPDAATSEPTPGPDCPRIGRLRMPMLEPQHFEKLYEHMEQRGLSRRSIAFLHSHLYKALDHARRKMHLIVRNPLADADLPDEATMAPQHRRIGRQPKAMSEAHRQQFKAALTDDPWSALWAVLFEFGLRPSEAFGLAWRHINFVEGTLRVEQTVHYRRKVERTWKKMTRPWELRATKTYRGHAKDDAGTRTLALSDWVAVELQLWKVEQAKRKAKHLETGDVWQDGGEDFVFTTEVGSPLGSGNERRLWVVMMRRATLGTVGAVPERPLVTSTRFTAGPRRFGTGKQAPFEPWYTPYDLRHTLETHLKRKGVAPQVIKAIMGHTKTSTVGEAHYDHTTAEDFMDAQRAALTS